MNKIIVILGPTAVGKTKMSIELAKKINGEIINADSTQVYKHLNIATAKIKEEEKENIPHYLFDFLELNTEYTVFDYQKDVRNLIKDIISRGKTPILCGGTGLYIKAALYNYEFKEEGIRGNYDNLTNQELYNKIIEVDKNTKIHINNRQRLLRAYDSIMKNGTLPNDVSNELLYDVEFIGLTTDREILYNRINKRVDIMVDDGLIDEAKWVYESNIRSKAIMTPIGYKELFPYFKKEKNLQECLDDIKQSSRRYAKRQYTWFNNQIDTKWFNVDFKNFNKTVEEVYENIK